MQIIELARKEKNNFLEKNRKISAKNESRFFRK
jgi:hypothetical protein